MLAPPHAPSESAIELFHAGGREAEIEEVFRRILATGAPLDQVEIACASDAHVALVWEKALRHDWAVTLGPASLRRRPVLAARSLDSATGSKPTSPPATSVVCCSPAIWASSWRTRASPPGRRRASSRAQAQDGDARPTGSRSAGCTRTMNRAPRIPTSQTRTALMRRAKAELTERVLDWMSGLIAAIPEPDGTRQGSAADRRRRRDRVHRTHDRAQECARPSCRLGAHRIRPGAARAWIVLVHARRGAALHSRTRPGAAGRARTSASRSPATHARFRQAGYSGRPHVFVVGLEEGRVFPSATEDAVLLDAERAAISRGLRLSTDRIDEAVYGFWRASLRGDSRPEATRSERRASNPESRAPSPARITFSYSCRDTREFRETYASWLMLQAFRLQQRNPAASYQEMKAALGEPKSMVACRAIRRVVSGGWWLRSVVGTAR